MKMLCVILDTVYDDYQTIWEILSVIEQNSSLTNSNEIVEKFHAAISELLQDGYIAIFKGTLFQGEEQLVADFVMSKEFIVQHKSDWKAKKYAEEDIKFIITEKGKDYCLNNCTGNG